MGKKKKANAQYVIWTGLRKLNTVVWNKRHNAKSILLVKEKRASKIQKVVGHIQPYRWMNFSEINPSITNARGSLPFQGVVFCGFRPPFEKAKEERKPYSRRP